jgi:hypothetical protein
MDVFIVSTDFHFDFFQDEDASVNAKLTFGFKSQNRGRKPDHLRSLEGGMDKRAVNVQPPENSQCYADQNTYI